MLGGWSSPVFLALLCMCTGGAEPDPPKMTLVCTDACLSSKENGSCDDGGERSSNSWCPIGSDCSDCGPRKIPELGELYYTVKQGDTLNKIGEQFGVTPDSIQIRNGIADPRDLEKGQRLQITKATEQKALLSAGPSEIARRRRVRIAARVLAFERLLTKSGYRQYVEHFYGPVGSTVDTGSRCFVSLAKLAEHPNHVVERPFPTLEETEATYGLGTPDDGAWWEPAGCTPRDTVAIIVPYRDRAEHLTAFLARMHPFLRKQMIRYRIFVIDQVDRKRFNRAKLLNVGATLAAQSIDVEKIAGPNRRFCFVFHDVDLLPESDQTLYTCPDVGEAPRHLSVFVDTHHTCLYKEIFGGVSVMNIEHFASVNGYSNVYWGWGGEDDDMSARIRCGVHAKIARPIACKGPCKFFRDCMEEMEPIVDYAGLDQSQFDSTPGHFVMIDGHSGTGKRMDTQNLKYLVHACRRFAGEGLTTLNFTVNEACVYTPGAYYHCRVAL